MFRKLSLFILMLLLVMNSMLAFGESEDTILKIGVKQEPDSLNPMVAWENASYEIFMLTYDALTQIDREMNVVPSLATSWELSEDQLTWTFHLREDVKWHDGEKFTANDVKFTYEFIQETEMGLYYGAIADITTIDVVDDYTIKFTSDLPKANMLQNVTPILPEHIWSQYDADSVMDFENEEMIGTGPYKFVEWQRSQQVVFERNEDYFGNVPQVSHLIYVIYANNDTMVQSLENGEIEIALGLDSVDIKGALKNENIKAYTFMENGFTQMGFNSSEPSDAFNPLIQNKVVRHAIDYAMDKQKIVDLVFDSSAEPGSTMIPPSQKIWHYEPQGDELRTYNPSKAIELLESEGFTIIDSEGYRSNASGEKLEFLLLSRSDNTSEVKVGQMIQSYLKDVGIQLNIDVVDDGVLYDRTMINLDYDMFIWGWGGDIDPAVLLNILTTSNLDNLNDVFYSNPDYDAIIELQGSEMNLDARIELVKEAQRLLYDELPYDILYYEQDNQLVRSDLVSGIVPAVNGSVFYTFTNANYLDAELVKGDESQSSVLMLAAVGVVILLSAVIWFMKNKKSSKKSENAQKQEW
ncbi:MAG: ABC transporter substrate-binding protein [Clostridia bacterium]|nr:ABC transporter substrate-binding protein [Clostridia bacterium]